MEEEFWHPRPEPDRPPNTYRAVINHPTDPNRTTHVALTQEHRFVLWFWNEWRSTFPPDVFSLDWHLDLAEPEPAAKQALQNFDNIAPADLSYHIWRCMSPYNDDHLLTAAWLGIINDIWLVYKQKFRGPDTIIDRHGNSHHIYKFHSLAEAVKHYRYQHHNREVIWDIDLDYFTNSPEFIGGGDHVNRVSDDEIARAIGPNSDLASVLIPDLTGITIATEPKFCGGIKMMTQILSKVDELFFRPSLLHHKCKWNNNYGKKN